MKYKISDSEFEVMEIIWENSGWVTINEVHTALSKVKKRAYSTIKTFMVRLCEKGFLESEKQGIANVYKALITKDEYIKEQTHAFLRHIHNGSKKSLIAALYGGKVSNEKIDELLKLLEG